MNLLLLGLSLLTVSTQAMPLSQDIHASNLPTLYVPGKGWKDGDLQFVEKGLDWMAKEEKPPSRKYWRLPPAFKFKTLDSSATTKDGITSAHVYTERTTIGVVSLGTNSDGERIMAMSAYPLDVPRGSGFRSAVSGLTIGTPKSKVKFQTDGQGKPEVVKKEAEAQTQKESEEKSKTE
ncbi:hypothetical protein C8R42DRAFT_715933 [Lentinula raphanica]|nr:hypothetical protein C8R42DRAFT_715933 [Lentinula raphanica]